MARLKGLAVRAVAPLRETRATPVVTVLLAGVALACCFSPGLDFLGYYSALVIGAAGGFLGGLVGVAAARASVATWRSPLLAALRASVWPATVPAVILLLNAFFVRNCDPLEGLVFYAVSAAFSVAWGACVGAFWAVLLPRRRAAVPAFVLTWLGFIAWDLAHLYFHPAVFAYDAFIGFFSGSVYDTVIEVDARFLLFRVENLLQLVVLWGFVRLAWDATERRATVAALRAASGRAWGLWAAATVALAVLFGLRGHIGWEVDRELIAERLGGRVQNDRVVLVYDQSVISAAEAAALLEDHTFRVEEIEATLETRYPELITSYVYGSIEQKRELMGAAQTYIAKPWLHEIHLNHVAYGASVVHHELAHVILGADAPGPLHLPTAMVVLPHMALVEGAAEAFEWSTGELTPHQWSAAMERAKIAPPLAKLLGPDGFYREPSSKAYTLTGSFVRWLLDTHGVARFRRCYADADFAAAYGVGVEQLATEWGAFIAGVELSPDAEALARARFSGKAVLYRTCPLEVAQLERDAGVALGRGDAEEALRLYDRVAGFVPDDPAKRVPAIVLAADRGDVAEASRRAADYRALDGRNDVTDARVAELVADATWRAGDAAGAARAYAAVAGAPQSEDRRRNVLVKGAVAADTDLEPVLGPYLLSGGGSDAEAIDYLVEAFGDMPDEPLVVYLLGRRMAQAGRDDDAVRLLERALTLTAKRRDPWAASVVRETWAVLARARFDAGDLAGALPAFEQAAALAAHDGTRDELLDWAARVRWKQARAARPAATAEPPASPEAPDP
ncbi:MAG: hypothetical protein H6745_10670 [Deltaproteobacteria bacterium]|nr:hypothetical protein [Deltaproteobacteria bacterium]